MRLTADQARAIACGDCNEDEFIVVESGEWTDDGKYSYCDIIFQKDNKTYELNVSRSGSYFTDYYYCWEDEQFFYCPEVEQVKISKVIWKVVKV
jgi:hypothetical protein